MARIVGVIEPAGLADPTVLGRMIAAACIPRPARGRSLCIDAAGLGIAGEGDCDLAEAAGLTVAIAGRIDDAGGLDLGQGDARGFAALAREVGFPEALARIEGDLAIAAWDATERVLWLGRDRFGVRPLYWCSALGRIGFASRPRPLLALAGVGADPDPSWVARYAASHYRTFDNDPKRSPYAAIAQIPAAGWLRFGNRSITEGVYWRLEPAEDWSAPETDVAARYRELLVGAVERRIRGAVRPAFTLSGGMDSSTVLATAATVAGHPFPAFSSVYADATYDESEEIRSMLSGPVSRWHPVPIDDEPELDVILGRMLAANDEPIATATWLSHWLVCETVAAAGHRDLFGGLGGDELNAGEYEYFPYFFADLRAAGDEDRLAREVAGWVAHHDHPVWRKSRAVAEDAMARLVDPAVPGRCLPDRARLLRYAGALDPGYFDLAGFKPIMDHPFASWLRNRTYQDLFRETTPCCLRAADRHAEAFGLTARWPFLDRRIAEHAFRVPVGSQIRDGVTKVLLREATRGLLPEATRTRVKKTGWNAPAHLWFAGGRGRDLLLDLIASRAFRERGIYDLARALALADEHAAIVASGAPRENHMMFLWQLVNLELWLRSLAPGGR